MQKTNIKASILIWAIFLSLIITVSFTSISTKINKSLHDNSDSVNQIKINNQVKNIINSWSINWTLVSQELKNWDKIIFDNKFTYTGSLKKWEIQFINIVNKANLNINILEWWPINTSSGLVINQSTFSNIQWMFEIINLWWYTKYQLSSTWWILAKFTNYKVTRQIWNKEVIRSKWKIKNF